MRQEARLPPVPSLDVDSRSRRFLIGKKKLECTVQRIFHLQSEATRMSTNRRRLPANRRRLPTTFSNQKKTCPLKNVLLKIIFVMNFFPLLFLFLSHYSGTKFGLLEVTQESLEVDMVPGREKRLCDLFLASHVFSSSIEVGQPRLCMAGKGQGVEEAPEVVESACDFAGVSVGRGLHPRLDPLKQFSSSKGHAINNQNEAQGFHLSLTKCISTP